MREDVKNNFHTVLDEVLSTVSAVEDSPYGTPEEQRYKLLPAFRDVLQFHEAFGHPERVSSFPLVLDDKRRDFRYAILNEEVEEFKSATTLEDQVDAMIDTIYIALGTLVELGVEPDAIFNIVQEANMKKLGADGKPLYHTEGEKAGKVKKPEGWQAPEPLIRTELLTMSHAKYMQTQMVNYTPRMCYTLAYSSIQFAIKNGWKMEVDPKTGEVKFDVK